MISPVMHSGLLSYRWLGSPFIPPLSLNGLARDSRSLYEPITDRRPVVPSALHRTFSSNQRCFRGFLLHTEGLPSARQATPFERSCSFCTFYTRTQEFVRIYRQLLTLVVPSRMLTCLLHLSHMTTYPMQTTRK